MRNTISLLSAALLLTVAATAQITIGPVAGINNTRYRYHANGRYQNPDRNDFVPDFTVGAIVDIQLAPQLYLQPGILYTRNSQKMIDPYSHEKRLLFNLNGIELPLSLVLKLAKKDRNGFFLSGGIFVGVHAGGSQRVNYYDLNHNYLKSSNVPLHIGGNYTNGFNRGYFGLRAETGYEFSKGYSLRLFYANAVTNLVEKPSPSDFGINRISYGLSFACQFHIRSRRNIPPPPRPPSRYNQPRRPATAPQG